MPQAVVAEIGWVAIGEGLTSIGLFMVNYSAVISTTLLIAGSYNMQARAARKARDAYNDSQVDRFVNKSTTIGPRELVLGKVRKGGTVIFRDSAGSFKEKFYTVIAMASHEIEGYEAFYLNDVKVTLDSNGWVVEAPYNTNDKKTFTSTSRPAAGTYVPSSLTVFVDNTLEDGQITYTYQTLQVAPVVRIRQYLGTASQTADPILMAAFPNVWTANHKLSGVAYIIAEFVYNDVSFPSGMPTITAVIKGAKVYDPRSGLTAWSDNPALHCRHVVTHPYFGKRSSLTAREDLKIAAAANVCETAYTPTGGTTTKLYSSHIVLPYGSTTSDALDSLTQAMCGAWAYSAGEIFIRAGMYTAPVKDLTQNDLVTTQRNSAGSSNSSAITINTHRARADKINTVTTTIWDSEADYKQMPTTPVKDAAAILKDGKELSTEVTLAAVTSAAQAKVIANYMLKNSYDPLALTATFKLSAYPVELFDNITLSIPRYGWSNKVFFVLGKVQTSTGLIELTLKETSASIYDPLQASNSSGYASNTNLIQPWDIPEPNISSILSGTDQLAMQGDGSVLTRVKVEWTPITDARVSYDGNIEVQWRYLTGSYFASLWSSVDTVTWNSITTSGSESSVYILGPQDGALILVRARSRNKVAVSPWSVQKSHTVIGKTAPPSDVKSLTQTLENNRLVLRWPSISDLDVAGYEIRSSSAGWGSAGELYKGLANSTSLLPSAGSNTFFIKAYDRSGNYSVNAIAINYTKPDVPKPTNFTTDVVNNQLVLSWNATYPEFGLGGYEVRTLDSGWGSGAEVFKGSALSTPVSVANVGVPKTWYLRTYDAIGTYSSTSTSVTYTVESLPEVSQISHIFTDTSLTAATVTLSWVDSAPKFGLSGYEITVNGTVTTVKANTITLPANWIGNRNFKITTVDSNGFKSVGAVYPVTKLQPNPALDFKAQVIDNTVLLSWKLPVKTSLPISHVLLKKLDSTAVNPSWSSATSIGTKSGEFTTIPELSSGTYTYFLAVVDTDGYESTPVQLTTVVAQPPDFVFYGELKSTFTATAVNAVKTATNLSLPVSTTETFAQHFTSRNWASPQSQITAGYPIYAQPGVSTGYYEEIFDFSTVVASSTVTVIRAGRNVSGTPLVTVVTSVSVDGNSWTDYAGLERIFVVNFRYVKVRITVTQASAGDLYSVDQLSVRLDSKLKLDSGVASALATDVNGTIVNFTTEFVDVIDITPSVQATVSRVPVYDFLDTVLVGTYTVNAGVVTVNTAGHNLLAGQKVRLGPSSGTLKLGVYTVSSVVNANSYTVNAAVANSSGNLTTYPNSFRVYVFDSAGVRQSNTISWTVRGS